MIFCCKDTPEGIFTAIYKAWEKGTSHTSVEVEGATMQLFEEYVHVEEDDELVRMVVRSIRTKLSAYIYEMVYRVCLSSYPDKAGVVYRFLQKAFRIGSDVMNYMQDEDVFHFHKISKKVSKEAHFYMEIIRFEEIQNQILLARIEPEHHILPLIVEHFEDRFMQERWMIIDMKREFSALHIPGNHIIFTSDIPKEQLERMRELSDDEKEMKQLWKCFFDSIAIEARVSKKRQQQMVPLKYRKYMEEMYNHGIIM